MRLRTADTVEVIPTPRGNKISVKVRLMMAIDKDTSFIYPDFNEFISTLKEILAVKLSKEKGTFLSRNIKGTYKRGRQALLISNDITRKASDQICFVLDERAAYCSVEELQKIYDKIDLKRIEISAKTKAKAC